MTVFKAFLCAFFFSISVAIQAQPDSLIRNKKADIFWYSGVSASYAVSMGLLYKTWFEPYHTGGFRFINDNRQWGGMDKIGHFTTAWWISDVIRTTAATTGMSERKATNLGLILPFAYMSTIEIFDGLSEGWGFSVGDMVANLSGLGFSYLQYRNPKLNEISIRYSYQNNAWPALRPEMLGASRAERMLKNYNGQTYWLSIPTQWIAKKAPKWLCISAGYSIDGYIGGNDNLFESQGVMKNFSHVQRNREFLLSFDVDLRKIPIRGKAWKIITHTIRWVKFPAPILGYHTSKGMYFSPLAW